MHRGQTAVATTTSRLRPDIELPRRSVIWSASPGQPRPAAGSPRGKERRPGPVGGICVKLCCPWSRAPWCSVRCVNRPASGSVPQNVAVPQELLANAEARLAGVRARAGWGARLGSFLAGSFVTRIVRNLSVTVRREGCLPAGRGVDFSFRKRPGVGVFVALSLFPVCRPLQPLEKLSCDTRTGGFFSFGGRPTSQTGRRCGVFWSCAGGVCRALLATPPLELHRQIRDRL